MNSEQFISWRHKRASNTIPSTQSKPLIMGVLNSTPDSFSDGGCYFNLNHAYHHAQNMIAQGADIIDVGGESTKPGAKSVSTADELSRVIPLIEKIRQTSDICISIDTYKAEVMEAALNAGANFINDIKALTSANALAIAAHFNVPVCLMHMQGIPETMQLQPHYTNNIITEINTFFKERIQTCVQAGIARENLILDPGFGFGKSVQHNLLIMKYLGNFQHYNLPLLLGVSRKSTIGAILNKPISERLIGGLALTVFAALQGVSIIRTHDVDETNQALKIIDAINQAE